MCRKVLSGEAGLGLVTAVFVLVLLGLLGMSLVPLVNTEQAAVNREVASARALFAAESAIQWGLYQGIVKNVSTVASGAPVFDGAPEDGNTGFAHCWEQTEIADGFDGPENPDVAASVSGGKVDIYRFEAAGHCYAGSPLETRRTLEIRFWDKP